jgi:hypothetical protein
MRAVARARPTIVVVALAALLIGAMIATPAASATTVAPTATVASRPYCGIWWGSLPERAGAKEADWLLRGRVGQHACFDRLVIELAGPAAGAKARYVRRIATAPGLRQPNGGARLQVRIPATLPPASATRGRVQSKLPPVDRRPMFDVRGFRTFRDVRWGRIGGRGSTIGLGVRARLPFRVFVLDGPGHRSRVVVDVAHRW